MTRRRALRVLAFLTTLWLGIAVFEWLGNPSPGLTIERFRSGATTPAGMGRGGVPWRESFQGAIEALGNGFRVEYRGWVRLDRPGVYHVAVGADAGSVASLSIDGEPIVGFGPGGGELGTQTYREWRAGPHRVVLTYRHGASAPPALGVTWSKEVAVDAPVPVEDVYGEDATATRIRLAAILPVVRGAVGVLALIVLPGLWLSAERSRAWQLALASIAVGCVGAALLAEGALRVAGVARREYVPGTIWLTYPYPKPGSTTRYVGPIPYLPREFEVDVTLNERGWRDRWFPYRKPEGVRRIVIVGDSYVEAKEVALDATFHKRLEARLNGAGTSRAPVEVIALARGGIGTEMALRLIRERAPRYHPDTVVLAFFAGNDVRENVSELDQAYQAWVERVYASRIAPSRVRCVDATTLWAASLLNNVVTSRLCDLYIANLDRFEADLTRADLASPDAEVYRSPPDERWRRAWQRSEALIVASKRAAEATGAEFVMLLVHSAPLVGIGSAGRSEGDEPDYDLAQPGRRLLEICSRHAIECLDLAPRLEAFAAQSGEDYHWQYDAHWNEAGHAVAAEALYELLERRSE